MFFILLYLYIILYGITIYLYIGKIMSELSIGKILKDLRNEKHFSQEALAELSGVTKSSISQMENDRLSPSINTLRKIARGLDVEIANFFDGDNGSDYISIVRKDEHKVVTFDQNSEKWQILASGIKNGRILGVIATLDAGDTGAERMVLDPGEKKLFYVLEGQMEFIYNDHVYILQEGDSVYFDGGNHHDWRNIGSTIARVLVILTK